MGDGARRGGGFQAPPQETPLAEEPAFVPRKLTPNQLFGSGRGDQVVAERQAAASQIQRTLRVWRKAAGPAEEAKGNDEEKQDGAEVSEPGEPAEKEADAVADGVADELHGDDKKGGANDDKEAKVDGQEAEGEKGGAEEKESEAGDEKAPEIGAKLEGVGRKVFLAKKDDEQRKKPVNLPAEKSITVDMPHIQTGHMAGGNRNLAGRKDVFPPHMDVPAVEAAIRAAYKTCKKTATQGDRVQLVGTGGGLTIEMWLNVTTKIIETAYPKS